MKTGRDDADQTHSFLSHSYFFFLLSLSSPRRAPMQKPGNLACSEFSPCSFLNLLYLDEKINICVCVCVCVLCEQGRGGLQPIR